MKALYRVRQLGMNIVMRITSYKKPKLISGNESLYKIIDILINNNTKRILLVTTAGFIRRKTLDDFLLKLAHNNIDYKVFSDVKPDPTIECVEQAVMLYKNERCEAIVAIGGGSVIDCSKVVGARVVKPKMGIRQMRGILKIRKRIPDLYAVPTTAGTGSEATAAAVITDTVDGTHYKYAVNDLCLIPKYAVLDPKLTLTLPKSITAMTGMDALTHAVEAYTNNFASGKVRKSALKAVDLIYENLMSAYENPEDIKVRENLLYGSYLAGIAFTNNFVGYVHAIAHAIGGLYGVPHGMANAILLPYVLEHYGKSVCGKLSELGKAAGIDETDKEKCADKFIDSIKQMNYSMGIPNVIHELKKEDYDVIITRAIAEANPAYPVPVIWNMEDFKRVLEQVLEN